MNADSGLVVPLVRHTRYVEENIGDEHRGTAMERLRSVQKASCNRHPKEKRGAVRVGVDNPHCLVDIETMFVQAIA